MRPTYKSVLFLLAVAAALAVAGCGGDDKTTESKTATTEGSGSLTKAELIEQGDAICKEVNAAVGRLAMEAERAKVPDSVGRSSELYLGMIKRLRKLGIPEDDDGSYAAFMRAAEQFAKTQVDVKRAVNREDPGALHEAVIGAYSTLPEFRAQAATYGFEECSEDAVAPS